MTVRPCFTAPAFTTFCGLVAGLAGQVRRRTVVGMLLGACLQRAWPHDRAHYFFSRARWQLDELGLVVARLVVDALIDPGADVTVALDDSVCVRTGPKVLILSFRVRQGCDLRGRVEDSVLDTTAAA